MSKDKMIPDKMYFRIGEAADILGVKPYVLRYWETEFPDIKPVKSQSNQRLYKRRDVEMLMAIKTLLYDEKFTINGARQHLKDMLKVQGKQEGGESPDLFAGTTSEASQPKPTAKASSKSDVETPKDIKKVLTKLKNDLTWCLGEMRK